MSDTAAAARAAYLGTDVIPWDELKPEMQERWQRVVEVVEEASTPLSMCPLCYRCHNSIRVPFSDGVIEKMAREASYSIGGWGYDNWDKGIMRDAWRASVRRALAAGGIDPCAVPQYAPEDVAFGGERRTERASDKELREIGVDVYLSHDTAKRENAGCMVDPMQAATIAVRARVEAPLLAEIRHLRSKLASAHQKTERQAAELTKLYHLRQGDAGERARLEQELATERDKANRFDATAQGLSEIVDGQKRDKDSLRNSLARVTSERDNLRTQLEAVTAERDESADELSRLQSIALVPDEAGEQLAAMHQPVDAIPSDAQVEALARVLQRAYMKECYVDANECTPNAGYLAEARAAYAHIGRVPVGWELDVTADEALRVYSNGGKSIGGMHNTLDLCRSRIKPVYECKECAKRPKNVVTSFNFTFDYDTGSWKVINIAPENES